METSRQSSDFSDSIGAKGVFFMPIYVVYFMYGKQIYKLVAAKHSAISSGYLIFYNGETIDQLVVERFRMERIIGHGKIQDDELDVYALMKQARERIARWEKLHAKALARRAKYKNKKFALLSENK
jgi:hypothetical protein